MVPRKFTIRSTDLRRKIQLGQNVLATNADKKATSRKTVLRKTTLVIRTLIGVEEILQGPAKSHEVLQGTENIIAHTIRIAQTGSVVRGPVHLSNSRHTRIESSFYEKTRIVNSVVVIVHPVTVLLRSKESAVEIRLWSQTSGSRAMVFWGKGLFPGG